MPSIKPKWGWHASGSLWEPPFTFDDKSRKQLARLSLEAIQQLEDAIGQHLLFREAEESDEPGEAEVKAELRAFEALAERFQDRLAQISDPARERILKTLQSHGSDTEIFRRLKENLRLFYNAVSKTNLEIGSSKKGRKTLHWEKSLAWRVAEILRDHGYELKSTRRSDTGTKDSKFVAVLRVIFAAIGKPARKRRGQARPTRFDAHNLAEEVLKKFSPTKPAASLKLLS